MSLTSYSGQKISTLGCIRVPLRYCNVVVESELIIVKGNRPCLLGRDLLIKTKLDWASIFTVSSETNLDKVAHSTNLDELLTTYKELFQQAGWMDERVLGHFFALSRLNWAGDNQD